MADEKQANVLNQKGLLIVLSGFSGSGKGTLVKKLLKTYDNYALSVSMTTRSPRVGERDGIEYFFVDRDAFQKTIQEEGLIEYAEYCTNYYGTPKAYVEEKLAAGMDVILEIEIQGALQIKKKFPESLLLFVTPPSVKELKRRLVGRGTETEEVIEKRLSTAAKEAEGLAAYDYLIINDDLDACVKQFHEIVNAARNVPSRNGAFIDKMKEELDSFKEGAK